MVPAWLVAVSVSFVAPPCAPLRRPLHHSPDVRCGIDPSTLAQAALASVASIGALANSFMRKDSDGSVTSINDGMSELANSSMRKVLNADGGSTSFVSTTVSKNAVTDASVQASPLKEIVRKLQPVAPAGFVWSDDVDGYQAAAAAAAANAYAAKKAAYDARRLVLIPPTGANKPKVERGTVSVPPAQRQASWPSLGGASGPHRMAGTMPAPSPREEWVPPAGWRPPSKPVLSWYDSGVRLKLPGDLAAAATSVASTAYAAKKAAYDARRRVLLPPTGANKPKALASWPSLGGASGPHRMAGTMPAPPPREEWVGQTTVAVQQSNVPSQPVVDAAAAVQAALEAASLLDAPPPRRRKRDMVRNFFRRGR